MKPLNDLVLIKADKQEERTASGLYIKEDWKTLPPKGTVEAVGDKVTQVKAGDRVVFERYGAVTYDKDLKLCKENQIMAVLNED